MKISSTFSLVFLYIEYLYTTIHFVYQQKYRMQPHLKDRIEASTGNNLEIEEFWFEVKWTVCGNQVGVYQYDNKGSYYENDSFKSCYHLFF